MNFEKHIDAINNIMQDTGNKLAALDAAIQTERARLQGARRGAKPGRLAALDEERQEAERKYRENTAAVIAEAQRAVKDARSALEDELKDFSVLHPEDVDNAAIALLNANIATAADLVSLANANGDNPTMLRLIASNAERLMDSDPTARALVAQIKVFVSPEARLSVFDGAMMNAHIGAGGDLLNIAAEAWEGGIYQKYRAEMQQLNRFAFSGE